MAHNQHQSSLLLLVKTTHPACPEHLLHGSLCGRSWVSMCLTEFPIAGHKGESWQTQVPTLQESVPLLLLQWKYLFSMFPPPSSNLAGRGHSPTSPSPADSLIRRL